MQNALHHTFAVLPKQMDKCTALRTRFWGVSGFSHICKSDTAAIDVSKTFES